MRVCLNVQPEFFQANFGCAKLCRQSVPGVRCGSSKIPAAVTVIYLLLGEKMAGWVRAGASCLRTAVRLPCGGPWRIETTLEWELENSVFTFFIAPLMLRSSTTIYSDWGYGERPKIDSGVWG